MTRRAKPQVDVRIATLRAQHRSEQQIADVLTREGIKMTASGVHRALGRLGLAKPRDSKAAPKRPRSDGAPPAVAPDVTAAEVPDEVPEGTPLEQINRWEGALQRALVKAEQQGNLAAIASLAAKFGSLASLKLRATPIAKTDLNEDPDYRAMAKMAEARLMALLQAEDDPANDSPAAQFVREIRQIVNQVLEEERRR